MKTFRTFRQGQRQVVFEIRLIKVDVTTLKKPTYYTIPHYQTIHWIHFELSVYLAPSYNTRTHLYSWCNDIKFNKMNGIQIEKHTKTEMKFFWWVGISLSKLERKHCNFFFLVSTKLCPLFDIVRVRRQLKWLFQ